MDKKELAALFPDGQFSQKVMPSANVITVACEQGFFHIPKEGLTTKERSLLELFAPQKTIEENIALHPWYQVLFQQANAPILTKLRVIQLAIDQSRDFMKQEWLDEIKKMFPSLMDSFFIERNRLLLIEEYSALNYSLDEIFGIFQSLDIDFDITTEVFIGRFHQELNQLKEYFQEEQQLFEVQRARKRGQKKYAFSMSALEVFLHEPMHQSLLATDIYKTWFADSEIKELLAALWECQGNISLTAKKLFLHRNTVVYRIDKFKETTQFDLKKMDDLVFCYLLVKNFSS